MCGLSPQEFYSLTCGEFESVVEGWELRDRWEWERTALIVSAIQCGQLKKAKSPGQILRMLGRKHLAGPGEKKKDVKADKEYLLSVVKRMNRG